MIRRADLHGKDQEAIVSDRKRAFVRAAEEQIEAVEGSHHVNGRYYGRSPDAASRPRRIEAERRVAEALRAVRAMRLFHPTSPDGGEAA